MPTAAWWPPQKAEYLLVEAVLPGRQPLAAGVLLLDPASDRLFVKLREDWRECADPEDAEVLAQVGEELRSQAGQLGAAGLMEILEDRLSNTLRLSERRSVVVGDFERALERLFERHVEGRQAEVAVIPFRTHVPLYSLRAAAGRFGPEQEVDIEPEGWIPAPEGLRALEDYFACHVCGRSMEPRIPDGSLCLFRRIPAGSRQDKLVLVRHTGASESGGEFTVKRYRSEKRVSEEGGWEHTRIVLEPLNPEYPVLELGPEGFQVIGEFVRVVTIEEV